MSFRVISHLACFPYYILIVLEYVLIPLPAPTSPLPRIFLRQVAEVGRPAGLRSGPLASFMCDALCFQDMPWLGFMGAGGGETSGGGVDSASWPKHRDMFRAILGSCISATR